MKQLQLHGSIKAVNAYSNKDINVRFIFVDAENTGAKTLAAINAEIADKVIVFSKDSTVRVICERKLFLLMSEYEAGANQADFYIIASLVNAIRLLPESQKETSLFCLYSQDNALVRAFKSQCKLHGVKHEIALAAKTCTPANTTEKPAPSVARLVATASRKPEPLPLEQQIYACFQTGQTAEAVRKKLNQPKPAFTRALNMLIQAKKIRRCSGSKKNWIAASAA